MEEIFRSTIEKEIEIGAGSVFGKCPSNIALIKYWGKKDVQIPLNPSLSFTLSESYTETELKYFPKNNSGFEVNVYLDGELKESFAPKIIQFFERIKEYIPFIESFSFEVHTRNTFPHSSGIASSASGMGAMSLALVDLEERLGGKLPKEEKLKKASFLARLGSGSACRSIYPGITVWGKSPAVDGSSDLYAIPYPYKIHENFQHFQDTILLIDEGQKEVSSTVGHNLMNNHPYAERRFQAAGENLEKLILILETGNLEEFGALVEHEALSLHAMMLTSNPAYILMKPNTLKAIEEIWKFRKETKIPVCFTLDAGANIHLLYPQKAKDEILGFIQKDLKNYCANEKFLIDSVSL